MVKKMVKYDNWCIDSSLCDKSTKIGTNDCYHIQSKSFSQVTLANTRYSPKIHDGRHKIQGFHIRWQWFHAHHRDRPVIFLCIIWFDIFINRTINRDTDIFKLGYENIIIFMIISSHLGVVTVILNISSLPLTRLSW